MSNAVATPVASTTIDLSGLPEDVTRAVRDLVAAAKKMHSVPPTPRPPLMGRFAHLGLDLPMEDFEAARAEMGRNFPREFPEPGPS